MNSSQIDPLQPTVIGNRAIAPAWHTAVLLIVMLGLSFMGARTSSLPGGTHGRILLYLLIMLFEWATVAFIWYGVSRRGIRMRDLIGGSWARPLYILRDLAIAVGFVAVCGVGLVGALNYLLKAVPNPALRYMLPHGLADTIFYLALTLTAGFCEEVIFRGYFQRQFAALCRSTAGGVVLQGIVFGAAHGYQGWKFMLSIVVFGVTFGLLVVWRRSLRPGMLAHFLQDAVGGILASHFMR